MHLIEQLSNEMSFTAISRNTSVLGYLHVNMLQIPGFLSD